MMRDIQSLIRQMVAAEEAFRRTTFLAPCLRGGRVRARVEGIVQAFIPTPADFEGWGLFQALEDGRAEVMEEADLPLVGEYLRLLPALRVSLAHPLQGQTWLAYPGNEADARQRLGSARPLAVHLVTEGARFEQVIVRGDGRAWWFDEVDRRADPHVVERLEEALQQVVLPEAVRLPGLTPEMRAVYEFATQQAEQFQPVMQQRRDEERLRTALRTAGGDLCHFRDRGAHWVVEWTARDGERQTSAISKRDLTVISAGICLSGEDRKFDLQSLVGVLDYRG